MSSPSPLIVRSPGLAGIVFEGPEAASFLHNQLSTDVLGMKLGDAGWTTYNSPKGRMLATPLLWRRDEGGFVAFVPEGIAEALRRRLAMFVLRAKVTVALQQGRHLTGVIGPGGRAAVEAALGKAPEPGHGITIGGAHVVALPDGRLLVDSAQPVDVAGEPADPERWIWAGVRAGVPQIDAGTQDMFVPQTANMDVLGGLNFRKGCYPGQEIVARMQYLGRLKERLFAFHVEGDAPAPGTRIVLGEDLAGAVVNAAASPEGGSDLLAVVQLAAQEAGGLHLGSASGPALLPLPLPYAIPAPAAPNRVKL
ncbi:MAG: folate-binding protein [Burkholderiales bacterium]